MDCFVFVKFAFISLALIILTISGSDAAEETPPMPWEYPNLYSDAIPSVRSAPMPQYKNFKAPTNRLPNNTKPLHYDVELSTDVHLGKYEFLGKVVIQLEVIEDTPKIVLHARQLNISEITTQKNGSETSSPANFEYLNSPEFLVVQNGNDSFLKDEIWALTIQYNGLLRTDNRGFYMSTYTDEKEVKHYLATTQFESTNARHGFPCFDEPSRRATFNISIKHDPSYFAMSNMPVDTEKSTTGYTVFLPTVNMSTYLVAFIVSDFNFTKGELYSLPQRVYSRPGTENEQEFALTTGMLVMQRLVEYFGIDFVMPKMDQVAVPDFASGAMENWGLVTYREEYLLFNKNTSTVSTQTHIASTIAHEYVHQWFGNYVAIKWWTYLWLKEGFATLISYQATNEVYPDWGVYQFFHTNDYQQALNHDAGLEPRPMTHYVESPKEIRSLYDTVSYSKAASVLFMWQNALTDEVFRQGLQNYLNANNFSAAEEGDLFAAIQKAVNDKRLVVPAKIDVMMSSWTRQGGYPVLTVERNYENGSFVIQQEPFYDDPSNHGNHTWYIPINVVVQSNPDFRDTRATHFMLMDKQINVDDIEVSKDDWLILNKQSTGYYRINYDDDNWALITEGLIKQPYKIHPRNRAQLIHDAYQFSDTDRLKHSIFMDLLTYLPSEDQYAPWATVSRIFQNMNRFLSAHEDYKNFKQYVAELVGNIYERLGVYEVPGEQHFEKFTRPLIIDLACLAGIESCLQETKNKLIGHIENGVEIEPNLQSQIYCNGLKQSGDKEFDFVYNELMKSDDQAKRSILIYSLGCAQKERLIKKFLESSINMRNGLRTQERTTLLYPAYSQGEVGFNACIDFLKKNYKKYANMTTYLGYLDLEVYYMSPYVVNKDQEKKLLDLVAFLKKKGCIYTSLEEYMNPNFKNNFNWFKNNGDPIMNYLSTYLQKPRNDGTVIHSSSVGIALIILLITLS